MISTSKNLHNLKHQKILTIYFLKLKIIASQKSKTFLVSEVVLPIIYYEYLQGIHIIFRHARENNLISMLPYLK